MKTPADPKWQQRRWQTFYESRPDYIQHLYREIRYHKHQIRAYEQFSARLSVFKDYFVEFIGFEKKELRDYQNELRKVLGR